jgi:trehalose/maltose hydrolase-like predicted phosphorylase
MAVLGFAGLSLRDGGLAIDPSMPAAWRSFGFVIQWRGRRVRFCIRQPGGAIEATLESGAPTTLFVRGVGHELGGDRPLRL